MSLVNPVPNFNFFVTLSDAEGPGTFGGPGAGGALGTVASNLLSGAINAVGQFLLGAFSECEGLDAELEIETYREGGRNDSPHRFVTAGRYQNLVLRRGVMTNTDIWDWHEQVLRGGAQQLRKNGLILLMDRGGPGLTGAGIPGLDRIPVAGWVFRHGLPERLRGPRLDAKGNEIAIEAVEISHEGLQRVSLAMIPGLGDVLGALGGLGSMAVAGAAAAGVAGATGAFS